MEKSTIIKIIKIILLISILISSIPTFCSASMLDDAFGDAQGFLSTGTDPTIQNKVNGVQIIKTSKDIYNILVTIGIIIAAIVILVLGIQFMTGSIEQKAKVKEMLIPFIVGCIVIFGSLTIWRLVTSIITKTI